MKNYIMLVMALSLGVSMLKCMFPVLYDKYSVSFVIKMIVVVVVLSPLIKSTGELVNFKSSSIINEESEHIIYNEDAEMIWKKALAENTAQTLEKDIEDGISKGLGVDARVVVPWRVSGENIIFEKLEVYVNCSEEKFKKIEDYIRIHYELDSVCKKDEHDKNKN